MVGTHARPWRRERPARARVCGSLAADYAALSHEVLTLIEAESGPSEVESRDTVEVSSPGKTPVGAIFDDPAGWGRCSVVAPRHVGRPVLIGARGRGRGREQAHSSRGARTI